MSNWLSRDSGAQQFPVKQALRFHRPSLSTSALVPRPFSTSQGRHRRLCRLWTSHPSPWTAATLSGSLETNHITSIKTRRKSEQLKALKSKAWAKQAIAALERWGPPVASSSSGLSTQGPGLQAGTGNYRIQGPGTLEMLPNLLFSANTMWPRSEAVLLKYGLVFHCKMSLPSIASLSLPRLTNIYSMLQLPSTSI